jgi:Fe-S cluster biogenesis protein NfuA
VELQVHLAIALASTSEFARAAPEYLEMWQSDYLMSPPNTAGDLKIRVAQVLAEEVRPVLGMDGGDLELLDIQDGVVQVRLTGGCGGCPGTLMAMIMGIEQELRKRIPEVQYLELAPPDRTP